MSHVWFFPSIFHMRLFFHRGSPCFTVPAAHHLPLWRPLGCQDYITHLFTGRRIMAKELNFLKQLPDSLKKEVDLAEVTWKAGWSWGSWENTTDLRVEHVEMTWNDDNIISNNQTCNRFLFLPKSQRVYVKARPSRTEVWLHVQKLSVLSEINKEDIRQICDEAVRSLSCWNQAHFEMGKSVVDISYHFMTFPGRHGPFFKIPLWSKWTLFWGNHGPFSRNNALHCRGGSSLCIHCGFWTRQRSSAGDSKRVHL